MPVDANSGRDKVDLLIVVPPFATTSLPMLGPSLLLAQCMAAGISGKVVYSNLHLASILGFSLYERIGLSSFTLMLGELVFRHLAFDGADPSVAIESFFASHDRLETSSALGSISRDEALVAFNTL